MPTKRTRRARGRNVQSWEAVNPFDFYLPPLEPTLEAWGGWQGWLDAWLEMRDQAFREEPSEAEKAAAEQLYQAVGKTISPIMTDDQIRERLRR